jgi:hypothetical protein
MADAACQPGSANIASFLWLADSVRWVLESAQYSEARSCRTPLARCAIQLSGIRISTPIATRASSENSPFIATRPKSSQSRSLNSKRKKLVPGEGHDPLVDGSTSGEETAETASNNSIGHYWALVGFSSSAWLTPNTFSNPNQALDFTFIHLKNDSIP